MSRTRHRGKQYKDWWGKRPLSHHTVSNNSRVDKFFKRLLHKIERKQGVRHIREELKSTDNVTKL